jgi:hypothetical protein
MNPTIFIDTEFTNLTRPELLSLGMVTSDGHEHYVELDLDDPASAPILGRASDFVRHGGVLEQWGRVAGSAADHAEMGRRTAEWMLIQVGRLGQPIRVAFDYDPDFELLRRLLQGGGQWGVVVGNLLRPFNVNETTSCFDAALGADAAYQQLKRRGLEPHHALADAHALRAAVIAVDTGKRVKL